MVIIAIAENGFVFVVRVGRGVVRRRVKIWVRTICKEVGDFVTVDGVVVGSCIWDGVIRERWDIIGVVLIVVDWLVRAPLDNQTGRIIVEGVVARGTLWLQLARWRYPFSVRRSTSVGRVSYRWRGT
jgi:hypothetical protein